jgi:hypothetical protein
MSGKTPTQNSLDMLRKGGYKVAIVEHWNSFTRTRQDMFGFVDLVALGDGYTIYVQSTSYTNISARVKKITEHENLAAVRKGNNKIHVHGWRKVKNRWQCKVVDLS